MFVSLGYVWQYQQHLHQGGLAGITCITIYSPALETLREAIYLKFWWHRIILLSPGHEFYVVQYCAGDNTSGCSHTQQ